MSSRGDRGGAYAPLVELTLARLRQFEREPEALFWTFAFPILIAIAMAVAFPGSKGADRKSTRLNSSHT